MQLSAQPVVPVPVVQVKSPNLTSEQQSINTGTRQGTTSQPSTGNWIGHLAPS